MAAYKNRIDLHMHTASSFDGNYPAEKMFASAVENELSTIAITDHFDVDFYERHNLGVRQQNSYEDVVSTKPDFDREIRILRGIEMGQPTYEPELTEKSLARYEYDFVIGSIHNLRNMPDFGDLDYKSMTEERIYELLSEYFNEMLILAKWNGFDTLAHLTYPLRYIVGNYKKPVDMSKYSEIIDEILLTLIKNEKALELNTAGLRQPIGVTSPDEGILRRYKELGGKLDVVDFKIFEKGEGIEKKEENFAEEVAKQLG